jgi:hypothetical protein
MRTRWGTQKYSILEASKERTNAHKEDWRLSRRSLLGLGVSAGVVAATGVGSWLSLRPSLSHADNTPYVSVVVKWNNAALQAIRDIAPGPTPASRALAIVHTCMYDAWTNYDPKASPTQPNSIKRNNFNNDEATRAVSYAAYTALMNLFPSEASVFQAQMKSLGYDYNNTSTHPTDPVGIGNLCAQLVLTSRQKDGSNQQNGYADTSGYVPVNTPTQIVSPLHWQPLLVNGKVQKFLTPHWGMVTPFALTSGSQFRPTPGPATDYTNPNGTYVSQAKTILQYSAQLNDTTKTIADYWANGPHTETPPGHWDLFVQFYSAQHVPAAQHLTNIGNDVKLFFASANALFDAGIACWDCKRAYDSVRPITAVHYLYSGQQITAWGGYNQGTQSIDGSQWLPYQETNVVTPNFPEYVSGHSTFSATGAYILQQFTGSDTFGSSYTATPGSSLIEPGFAPSTSVTLSWPTYSSAAAEAGISRQYGGIHFNQGDQCKSQHWEGEVVQFFGTKQAHHV